MNRVVRIGQQRSVECLRLIARGTAEELVYHRQIYKTHLAKVANTAQQPARSVMVDLSWFLHLTFRLFYQEVYRCAR